MRFFLSEIPIQELGSSLVKSEPSLLATKSSIPANVVTCPGRSSCMPVRAQHIGAQYKMRENVHQRYYLRNSYQQTEGMGER